MAARTIAYEAFVKAIESDPIAPFYVIYGDEDLLSQTALKQIKKRLLGDGQSYTNLTEVEGDQADPARLFDLLRTRSLFGEQGRHLVVMGSAAKFIRKHAKPLDRYRGSPSSSGSLVLMIGQGDRRADDEMASLAKKFGLVVDCRRPWPDKIPGFVARMALQLGKRMDEDAVRLLIELVGSDLGQLYRQAQNLASMVSDRPRIGEDDVMRLVGSDFQRDTWELLNAVAARRSDQALMILDRLMRQARSEEAAIGIIGLLAYDLRQLAEARRLLDEGKPESAVVNAVTGPRAVRMQRVKEARRTPPDEIYRRTRLLAEADMQGKSSTMPTQVILELLVLRMGTGAVQSSV